MKTYITLLRGINVSGKNIIKMDALKKVFIDLGLENVQTYIQSGNVIFNTNKKLSKSDLTELISNQIKLNFQLEIPVLLLENEDLDKIVKHLPFSMFDEKNIYLTFLNHKSIETDFTKIYEKKSKNEIIHINENVIYLNCPDGYGNTKISNNFLEKQLKVLCTTRNLKTTKKLLELSSIISITT